MFHLDFTLLFRDNQGCQHIPWMLNCCHQLVTDKKLFHIEKLQRAFPGAFSHVTDMSDPRTAKCIKVLQRLFVFVQSFYVVQWLQLCEDHRNKVTQLLLILKWQMSCLIVCISLTTHTLIMHSDRDQSSLSLKSVSTKSVLKRYVNIITAFWYIPKGVDVYVWSAVSSKLHQNVDPISLGHPDAIKVDKCDAQICNINKLLHISVIALCMPIVIKPVIAHQHSNYIIQDDLKSTFIW